MQISYLTLAVVLMYYIICCISVRVVRPRVKGEQTIFTALNFELKYVYGWIFFPSDTFSVIPTRIRRGKFK